MEKSNNDLNIGKFVILLKTEMARRCDKNPRYSLRAYARSLGINHATLSRVLGGRRALTPHLIRTLGSGMNLSPAQIEGFVAALGSTRKSMSDLKYENSYETLSEEKFRIVADWYHDAICEMTHLKNFKPDERLIAKTLGISPLEVKLAVERLQAVGLLEVHADGRWIDCSRNNSNVADNIQSSPALRKYQKEVLELSAIALEEVPRDNREHVSNMVAIQREDLPKVKELIARFRSQLSAYLQRSDSEADAVYLLSISMFPVACPEQLAGEA